MQRFFDQPVRDMRAIEVTGVDVIDAEANYLAQDGDGAVVVCWRPEDVRAS